MIFIVNRSKEEKNYSISKYLKDYNFEELYEKFEVKQDNKNLSILEKLKKKNKSNELTDNIISVNLLSTESTKMFGISSIFKATLKLIKKNNPLHEVYFNQLNEIKIRLDELNKLKQLTNEQKSELETYKNKCQIIFKQISSENSFLESCQNLSFVLEKAKIEAKCCIVYNIIIFQLLSLSFNSSFYFTRFLNALLQIKYCYKLFTNEITFEYIFDENENIYGIFICDQNHPKEEIKEIQRQIRNKEIINNGNVLIFNQILNFNSNFLINIFMNTYNNFKNNSLLAKVINYFEEYVKKQFCINYIINEKKIYSKIIDQVEELSKKKNWDNFHENMFA